MGIQRHKISSITVWMVLISVLKQSSTTLRIVSFVLSHIVPRKVDAMANIPLFDCRMTANGEKEFNKVLNEYSKWTKRQPAEIVNAKLYFIALRAMNDTKTANKENIRTKLEAPSESYPDVSLAAILVNQQLGKKGKKGLTGPKMATAIEKLIKKEQSRTQFLRSGWLPAVKNLDYYNKRGDINFIKRFAPKKPHGVRQYGKDKGSCIFAKERINTWGRISNFVGYGKQATPTVNPILQTGLDNAVKAEIASMRTYITKKHSEQFDKMKRTHTI